MARLADGTGKRNTILGVNGQREFDAHGVKQIEVASHIICSRT